MAATTGLGSSSRRRSADLTFSDIEKTEAASSGPAWTMPLRSPPAKKVFFALAITTPAMLDGSAASSSSSLSTAAFIESM